MVEEVDLIDQILLAEAGLLLVAALVLDVAQLEGRVVSLRVEHRIFDFDLDVGVVDEFVVFVLLSGVSLHFLLDFDLFSPLLQQLLQIQPGRLSVVAPQTFPIALPQLLLQSLLLLLEILLENAVVAEGALDLEGPIVLIGRKCLLYLLAHVLQQFGVGHHIIVGVDLGLLEHI